MTRFTKVCTGAAAGSILAVAFLSLNAFAQDHGGMHRGMMMNGTNKTSGTHDRLSKPMKLRVDELMTMHVNPYDPDAVLALKADLKLSDTEVQQINKIAADARAKVEALLTAEQKTDLRALEQTPDNSLDMHHIMMAKMHGGHMQGNVKKTGSTAGNESCPMMKMVEKDTSAHTSTHAAATKTPVSKYTYRP